MKRKITFDISKISEKDLLSIGIYKILNPVNGKFYIGSASRNFKERFKEHCRYYEQWINDEIDRCHTPLLWNSFKKYGIENFQVEILEILNGKSECDILKQEEYYIQLLFPEYNICQFPTQGGSPNKNRKLSEEWKNNIAKKSSQYKHSEETLKLVTKNNKNNATKLKFYNDTEELFFESWKEASIYFNVSSSAIQNSFKLKNIWKDYQIDKLSTQSKKIKVFIDNQEILFNSYNECDKYFNMWRGYTSTLLKSKNNKLIIDKYSYELI